MGDSTTIEWVGENGHTFNAWIGCEKVSAGCKHCYAERDTSSRVSKARGLPLWGSGSTRHRTSAANWKKPFTWNRKARYAREYCARHGLPYERPRVFCASLADVFEGGRPELDVWRADLWRLIEQCDELDWLLLTKRPENVKGMVPLEWLGGGVGWPRHVWLGTTVENQAMADERIPHLLRVPAAVRFLSIEPLLGPVDLAYTCFNGADSFGTMPGIHWVIVGGESGPGARPIHPDWVRSIRDQCVAAGVPFFFKQWGEFASILDRDKDDPDWRHNYTAVRDAYPRKQFLNINGGQGFHGAQLHVVERFGKKAAGRVLDGRTWDEVPNG